MNKTIAIFGLVLVFFIGLFVGNVFSTKQAAAPLVIDGANSNNPTVDHFLTVDGIFKVTGSSPDGFVLWDDFTVGTTTPVRAALTNPSTAPADLICDGSSLAIRASSTADFAPSFKYTVGTTTSATGYSANIIASTTVATSTLSLLGKASSWPFMLPRGSSITLSVGDYTAAIASSTYYGNWNGQVSISCRSIGE